MEGAPRSCEDKHFVLYKSHFLWTQEAYQHHKEPQWGSEIQANTATPPLLPTFVIPTCPAPLHATAALCVLLCQYAGVLVAALCLWGGLHCTGTLIRF